MVATPPASMTTMDGGTMRNVALHKIAPVLVCSLLFAVWMWQFQPTRRPATQWNPSFAPEQHANGRYRWIADRGNVRAQLDRYAEELIVQQRVTAGPDSASTRLFTIEAQSLATRFMVQGGVIRSYAYLLPVHNDMLYARYGIAPLQESANDGRRLGIAVFDTRLAHVQAYRSELPWKLALGSLFALIGLGFGWRGCVLLGCATGMLVRAPLFFQQPRFWAEEGNLYFAYAYTHPWYIALVTPHLGYFSLLNTSASILAAMNMIWAPTITTWIALIMQLLPITIVVFGRSPLYDSFGKKAIVLGILLFAPISNELWLTTISSQFHLSLATFLSLSQIQIKIVDIPGTNGSS